MTRRRIISVSYFLLLDYNIWICGVSVFISFKFKNESCHCSFELSVCNFTRDPPMCSDYSQFCINAKNVGKHDRSART